MPKDSVRHVKFTPEEMAYEIPDELDLSKLTPVIGEGIFAAELVRGVPPLKVIDVIANDRDLIVSLKDGRKIIAPIGWYPRLVHASPRERNDWRAILGGRAISWRALGLAISAKALLEGIKANESASSLRKWLATRPSRPRRKIA